MPKFIREGGCGRHFALGSKQRSILHMLGFRGVYDFAKKSGIGHETAGAIIGTCDPRYKSRPFVILKAHSALHGAFMRVRDGLTPGEIAMIQEWHNDWKQYIQKQICVTRPGRVKNPSSKEITRMRKHRADLRQATKEQLDALVWEAPSAE